jgi:phosphoribosylformimino-5-aminoimidazole carboxamide ribotide isomerase
VAIKFPDCVALGIDAQKMPLQSNELDYYKGSDASQGGVMGASSYVGGWQVRANRTVGEMLRFARGLPLAAIIYTDIARDGMMVGPNVEATGGVTTADDVRRLKKAGAAGAIIGRALYEGKMTLEAALQAAQGDV